MKAVKARKDAPAWRRDQDAGRAYSLGLIAVGLNAIAVNDTNGVAPWRPAKAARPRRRRRRPSLTGGLVVVFVSKGNCRRACRRAGGAEGKVDQKEMLWYFSMR